MGGDDEQDSKDLERETRKFLIDIFNVFISLRLTLNKIDFKFTNIKKYM